MPDLLISFMHSGMGLAANRFWGAEPFRDPPGEGEGEGGVEAVMLCIRYDLKRKY